jgi:hypothetical protein
MADVITDLTDDDIETTWRGAEVLANGDDDATDPGDATDSDDDASDSDDDASDSDDDASDS